MLAARILLSATAHALKAGTPFDSQQRVIDFALNVRCFLQSYGVCTDYAVDRPANDDFISNDLAGDPTPFFDGEAGAMDVAGHLTTDQKVFHPFKIAPEGEPRPNDRKRCGVDRLGLLE